MRKVLSSILDGDTNFLKVSLIMKNRNSFLLLQRKKIALKIIKISVNL